MVWGSLGGRKDGKRTKADPELIRNSQRTKAAAEGSQMLTSDGWDLKAGLLASNRNKSETALDEHRMSSSGRAPGSSS